MFAPGGDLGGRQEPGDEPMARDAGADILPFLTIRDSPAPVIAAVNGICQAGGLLIAMMADIAVVSDRATFRVPELLRGITDATYAAVLPGPRRHRGGARPAAVGPPVRRGGGAAARPDLAGRAPRRSCARPRVEAASEVLQTAPRARGAGQAHAQRALRLDRLPDDVLGARPPDEPREGMLAFMEKRPPAWVPPVA